MSWLQIGIIVLLASGSFLQWLFKKLAEQKAIKEAQRLHTRAQEEALRTGRNPLEEARAQATTQTTSRTPPPRSPSPNYDDIAARRRAQLEQIRRQREAARRTGTATPPTAPSGTPPPRPVGAPRPAPSPRAPHPVRPARAAPQPRPARANLPPPPSRRPASPTVRDAVELLVDALPEPRRRRAEPSATPPAALAAAPSVRNKWREAIVMREILERPVADRDPLEF